MKLKYVTKPILINLLRYFDKNKILFPHRICYSSFRSKRDMLADFEKYYSLEDTLDSYTFIRKPSFRYLVAPELFHFCKKRFVFVDHYQVPLDLTKRPEVPNFRFERGSYTLEF